MNQGFYMGNLTRDPKLHVNKNGGEFVTFGMATNRYYRKADGTTAVESTYLDMEAWDSGARKIHEIFRKGDKIMVEASAKNFIYIDDNGNEQRKIIFRVSKFYPLMPKQEIVE